MYKIPTPREFDVLREDMVRFRDAPGSLVQGSVTMYEISVEWLKDFCVAKVEA